MISVPLRNFDLPVRTTKASATGAETMHVRDVAWLIRLLHAVQRAATEPSAWEEVSRLFVRLSESFNGERVEALKAVREWIGDDDRDGHSLDPLLARLPPNRCDGDAADALRGIVAPAVAEAVRCGNCRDRITATEARLELCVEQCAQGVLTFAPDGACVFVNRAATRLLRMPVEPRAALVDRRLLHRAIRGIIDEFVSEPEGLIDSFSARSLDVNGERVECRPMIIRNAGHKGAEAYLNLLFSAEANSDDLAERLLRRARFSRQETSVVRGVIDGKSYAAIAGEMRLSVHTIRTYADRIYDKLDVKNREELLRLVTTAAD